MSTASWNSEYDVIILAKDGDQDALQELYDKYIGVIVNIANMYRDKGTFWEDLISASKAGFFHALSVHDPNVGYLGPYAQLWCREFCKRQIMLKKPVRVPRDKYKEITSVKCKYIDNMGEDYEFEYPDEERKFKLELIHKVAKEILNKQEYMIFTERQKKVKYKDLGKRIGTTPQQACNIYNRSLAKIRTKIEEDYDDPEWYPDVIGCVKTTSG